MGHKVYSDELQRADNGNSFYCPFCKLWWSLNMNDGKWFNPIMPAPGKVLKGGEEMHIA